MLEALDKAPKVTLRQSYEDQKTQHSPTYFDDFYIQNEYSPMPAVEATYHSTPSKKQSSFKSGSYSRVRNNSLPSNHNIKTKHPSHYYSHDRCNSMESDLELAYSSQSIVQERRSEFERRRRQVYSIIAYIHIKYNAVLLFFKRLM